MSRHTKLAKSTPETGPVDPDALLERAVKHLISLLSACEATLAAGNASPALARESAGVARSMASLSKELRQRELHAKQVVGRMSPDELDEVLRFHIAGLSKERQQSIRDFVVELCGAGSVL